MTRVLLDQGLPRTAAAILRARGWDVIHVAEAGLASAADNKIIAHALADDRIVITLDADFHRILALSRAAKPSVVRIRREGLTGESLADLIGDVIKRAETAISAGALITVTAAVIRIRSLPLAG